MPSQMNAGQARVVDQILTTVARGYKPTELVSTHLFPIVPVGQRGGKIIKFGAEEFAAYATARVPGENTKRVNFGYTGESYSLNQNALEGQVPVEHMEEAQATPGINLQTLAVQKTMHIISMGIERIAAQQSTNPDNYAAANKEALSGADKWSAATSKPAKQIEEAKEAVRSKIAMEPNVMIIGQNVMRALRENGSVRDRIKYTSGGEVNTRLLQQYFDVEKVVVARTMTGAPGNFSNLWGSVVILAYVDVSSLASMGSPSFGYTYRLHNYPIVEQGYYENNSRSWIYPVVSEDTPVIAGADAGFLLTNVV